MSVQSEITRIQDARNVLRTKGESLGVCLSTDNLTQIATKYDGITDQGTPNAEVKEGESYTLEAGYYHGGSIKGVSGGGNYKLQAKSVTPTKAEQVVDNDSGYYGLDTVTVAPIPDAYQDVTDVSAAADDVLTGKIIVLANGKATPGTMPNNASVSRVLDTTTTSYTIDEGYHDGTGTVSISLETPSNVTPSKTAQTVNASDGHVISSITVNAIPSQYGDATNKSATSADILSGVTAIGYDNESGSAVNLTGSMVDNGTVTQVLDATAGNQTKTIAAGKHSGSGTVSIVLETKTATPSTSSQDITPTDGKVLSKVTVEAIPTNYADVSDATGTAPDVLYGKVVYGKNDDTGAAEKLTGTMTNNGAVSPTSLAAGDSYTIPAGYHNGSGVVTAKTLLEQTTVDSGETAVTEATMLDGYQGWVNGTKITGSMANNGAISGTITGLGSVEGDTTYTIAAGYTTGGTVSLTNDIENQLTAI